MMPVAAANPTSKSPLVLFVVLVTVLAAVGYAVAFAAGELTGGLLMVQFAPLLAAFAAKLTFQRNLRGLGWGWGKTRYQLAAYGLAFLLPLLSFALVWLTGLGGFYDAAFIAEAQAGLIGQFGIALESPYAVMLVLILLNGTLGMVVAFAGIGEELGWRGFLVPELYKHVDFTGTALISGAIWAVYHFPLLFLLTAPRLGVSAWPLMVFALVGGIGLSTIMAWLRLRSGSVWTAVLFHIALNIHTQGFFQNLTVQTSWLTNYVSGEHGLMAALVSAAFGFWFWRKRAELPRGSGDRLRQPTISIPANQ